LLFHAVTHWRLLRFALKILNTLPNQGPGSTGLGGAVLIGCCVLEDTVMRSLVWIVLLLAACSSVPEAPNPAQPPRSDGALKTITYIASSEDFPNPERGFTPYINLEYPAELSNPRALYGQGYTLGKSDVLLEKWRYSAIPQDYLDRLDRSFGVIRQGGMKVSIRFMYNSPGVGSDYRSAQDAPLERVLAHIKQLEPLLRKNADVIAMLQAGFIGAWGEWHTSSNGLTSSANKSTILNALLNALPPERMVLMRTVPDIAERYSTPISASEAYQGSAKARIGLKNLCFLADSYDAGTYSHDYRLAEGYRNYLAQTSSYAAVGGETCEVNASNNRTACSIAVPEMARFHWSYLNNHFYRPNLERWKAEGCYSEISRRLGYRLRLTQAQLPEGLKPGDSFSARFTFYNEGFAAPYNPRGLELVLRHKSSGSLTRFNLSADPRRWMPGQSQQVELQATLPSSLPAGAYEALLNLPDPKPNLYARPEYAIRLANQGTWESGTGLNRLLHSVSVGL
jgi:hypothetical protein